MPDNSAVKNTARVSLRSFWPQGIAVAFILIALAFIIYSVVGMISAIFGRFALIVAPAVAIPAGFLLAAPLILGILRYFWRATFGTLDSMGALFYYFEKGSYRMALQFSVMFVMRHVIAAAVCFFPYAAATVVLKLQLGWLQFHNGAFYIQLLCFFLGVIGTVGFVLFATKYYLAPMLFVSCEDKHWTEVFYLSKRVSRYTSGSFLVLICGLLGWIALSFLGITMLYTLPYILACYAVHARYSFNYYNHNMSVLQETGFGEYRSIF